MKTKNYLVIASLSVMLLHANFTQAQWQLTGNTTSAPNNVLGTLNNTNLDIRTKNVTRMYIKQNNGFIGIGTTAPVYKIDVNNGDINTNGLYRLSGDTILRRTGSKTFDLGGKAGTNCTVNGSLSLTGAGPKTLDVFCRDTTTIGFAQNRLAMNVSCSTVSTNLPNGVATAATFSANAVDNDAHGIIINSFGNGGSSVYGLEISAHAPTGLATGLSVEAGGGSFSGATGIRSTVPAGPINNWAAVLNGNTKVTDTLVIGTNPAKAKLDVQGNAAMNDNTLFLRGGNDPAYGVAYDNAFGGARLWGYNGGTLGATDPVVDVLTWTWNGASSSVLIKNSLNIDRDNINNGNISNAFTFGSSHTEGIASKRTAGGNQNGLDFYTNSVNRMSISNGGLVGMGITPSGANRLTIAGSALASGGTWVNSDERYKKDILPIENALEQVMNLNGVTYNYKTAEFPQWNFDNTKQIGVIAQEVEKVFPELVKTDADGYKAVSYEKFAPILIEAIKDQQKQIAEKDANIDEIKKDNDALKKDNADMKARMDAIEKSLAQCCTNYEPGKNTAPSFNNSINDSPELEHNQPNPFNTESKIKFYIPAAFHSAQIIVKDLAGKQLKTFDIKNAGYGEITIHANELASGSYLYSLIVDGEKTDSKKMELTK